MTCGTGGWTGPKPGDPDNNIVLTAQTVSGGIEVEWTYPSINPQAVAFVMLFRGTTPNYYQSVQHKIVSGSSYFDRIKVSQPTQYFYWIKVVSVNATIGELIGPASAFATSSVADLIEYLTGQIDNGLLAQSLQEAIAKIPLIETDLAAEALNRINATSSLSSLITQIQTEYGDVQTLVLNEIQQRETADSSIVNSMNLMYADFEDSTAAILEEQEVLADDISSLASRVVTLEASVTGDIAILLSNYETAVDAQAARAGLYNTLTTNYQGYVSTLLQDYETVSNATTARGTLRTQIQSDYETHVSNVLVNYQTISAAASAQATLTTQLQSSFGSYVTNALTNYYTISQVDSAISGMQNTVQSYTDNHLVSVNERLEAWIDDSSDRLDALGALYTVRVNVNGLVGGFGIYNNGQQIEAGFDVDTFWIGRTNDNRVKPFIVYNGVVYIDNAMIRQLTADKIDTRGLTIRDMAGNIIFGAGTGLNWDQITGDGRPEDGATVGADSSNLNVGIGRNLLPNSDFSSGIQDWVVAYNPSGGTNHLIGNVTQTNNIWGFVPIGQTALRLLRFGNTDTAVNTLGYIYAKDIPILPNMRYELSAMFGTNGCTGSIGIVFYHYVSGVRTAIGNSTFFPYVSGGGASLTDMSRTGGFVVAPANATVARITFRASAGTITNPDLYITRIFFAQAFASQTVLSDWSDGSRTGAFSQLDQVTPSNVTTYIANAAIQRAQIANLAVGNAQIENLAVDTFKLDTEAVIVSRYGEAGDDDRTFTEAESWVTLLTQTLPISGLSSGETASVAITSVTQISPYTGGETTFLGRILIGNTVVGDGGVSLAGYALQLTMVGYGNVGNGTHTVRVQVRTTNDYGGGTTKRVAYLTKNIIQSAKK